jgi:type I restriction-modification system DNA methylase subunit
MKKKLLSNKEASEILEVSTATIRNWEKLKYLISNNKNKIKTFYYDDIIKIKKQIKNGNIDKLNKRANKKNSNDYFIPLEYLDKEKDYIYIKQIIKFISNNKLSYRFSLFVLTLNYLYKKKIVNTSKLEKLLLFNKNNFLYKKNKIYSELKKWFFEDNFSEYEIKSYKKLMEFELPPSKDILGLLHQSFKIQSDKSKEGSFYTPENIVKKIVLNYCKKDFKVLDPCCGTGQFLLKFADIISNPNNIFGFDIDNTAIRLARINLMLKYLDINFSPNIFVLNSIFDLHLKSENFNNFDIIATNPPWGSAFLNTERKQLNKLFPNIKSGESFSYIFFNSIQLLKTNGIISFILPESILNVKLHYDIRKYLLEQTDIIKIIYFNRIFKNVFTPVIRIDCKKTTANFRKQKISIEKFNTSYKISQSRFKKNTKNIFDIFMNNRDEKIINKIFSKNHITLKNKAEWAMGIVTGNNKKFVSNKHYKGFEPIYKGKDIKPFYLNKCNNFIKFEPGNFQQVALESKYRAQEKLIYKFISNKLVFAYDDKQFLTLNSANILIPLIPNYPIKTILSFFNHPIYQFIYKKQFMSLKVLKNHLESLPLPIIEENLLKKIVYYADEIIYNSHNTSELFDLIFDIFNFTNKEQRYIIGEL